MTQMYNLLIYVKLYIKLSEFCDTSEGILIPKKIVLNIVTNFCMKCWLQMKISKLCAFHCIEKEWKNRQKIVSRF